MSLHGWKLTRTLIDTWQERPERLTGIYAFNDEYALCLLAALTDRGIQVPREMAIVGTDDSSTGQFVRPSLTSIGFGDGNTLGQLAVEMLVNQFTDQSSTLARSLPLSPQLTPRSSSQSVIPKPANAGPLNCPDKHQRCWRPFSHVSV